MVSRGGDVEAGAGGAGGADPDQHKSQMSNKRNPKICQAPVETGRSYAKQRLRG